MKRIKAMNGYTIYEVTARDEKQGNGTAGEYAIFFSSDIRDYGVAYSTPEYEGIDTLEQAVELIEGEGNYAKARELCERESTAVTFEDIEEMQERLNRLDADRAQEVEAGNMDIDEAEEAQTADTIKAIRAEADAQRTRSAWSKGVNAYAHELIDRLQEAIEGGWFDAVDLEAPKMVEKALLNGASDWSEYSWGGCSLIYDYQIAHRLCNPSELKKTDNGRKDPNPREQWLDTQARALFQAAQIVKNAVKEVTA